MLRLIAGPLLVPVKNVLNLYIDQMKKLVTPWREIIAHGPGFGVGTKEEAAGGYLTERVDAEICDVLDTLMDVAEDMRIPNYTRYMVSTFVDEPCNCPDCQCETPQWLAPWLWKRAQKYHSDLPPAMFERVFAELRAEAAQNQSSLPGSAQRL